MSSEQYPLRNSGIYHSLPQFDPNIKDLTAFVTGANGISGFHTLRALLDSPQRWAKIYALSRRPPPPEMMKLLTDDQRAKVEHIACDFLKDPKKIADAISQAGVKKADYVFFYSYLQPRPPPGSAPWSNAEELVKVNSALFDNFLGALTTLKLSPKRILLQTGAKNYGLHVGRARNPALESDPQPKHLEPNFYYPQEASLFKYCQDNPSTGWNVIRPAWIIGSTNNAQMNALHPFAIYAAVCAKRGVPLAFPSTWESWMNDCHHSTARLTGYLSEWAVLEDKCKNEAFNSQDTSPVTFDRFFERLVEWFAVEKGVKGPADSEDGMAELKGRAGKETPMGYGPSPVSKFSFTLSAWAKESENQEAWKQIQKDSPGVKHDPFEDIDGNFTFGDGAFLAIGCLGMNKARRLGWTGFVDTMESVFEMYKEMGPVEGGGIGMLPAVQVKEPKPLV